ncbi:MAG: flippase-like domain-containing protein [Actinomycetota bacterium]|nr:flippase-like domain-containing protein [Actinomycetota bacterium]
MDVRSRRKLVVFGLGCVLGGAAIFSVVTSAGGFADAIARVRHVHLIWIAVGLIAELCSFVATGALLRRLVGREARLGKLASTRLAFVILGLGNVLPAAPAEGLTMAAVELRRREVEPRRIALALGLMQWFTNRAIFFFLALNLLAIGLLVQDRHDVPHRWGLAMLALAILASFPLTARLVSSARVAEWLAIAIGRLRFWRPRVPPVELRAIGAEWHVDTMRMIGSPVNRLRLVGSALIACMADAACFWFSLSAAGVDPRPGGFIVAYGAGLLAALVPFLPGGFGAVEVAMPAVLHKAGVPLAPALAGVLTYRVLGTLLPAFCGAIALVRLRRTPLPEAPDLADEGELADLTGLAGALEDPLDQPGGRVGPAN